MPCWNWFLCIPRALLSCGRNNGNSSVQTDFCNSRRSFHSLLNALRFFHCYSVYKYSLSCLTHVRPTNSIGFWAITSNSFGLCTLFLQPRLLWKNFGWQTIRRNLNIFHLNSSSWPFLLFFMGKSEITHMLLSGQLDLGKANRFTVSQQKDDGPYHPFTRQETHRATVILYRKN